MERDLQEAGLDFNIIYIDPPAFGNEAQSGGAGKGTVIDLQRYRILRTMRNMLNAR
jgi:hypothetical protein